MERGVLRVAQRAGRRTKQHPRDGGRRIAVLAQEVADARAVTSADGGGIVCLAGMLDDERRVVLDARAAVERADQIVDLLARRRRQAEPLVERTDALDELAPEEEGERDRAVPKVVARQCRRLRRPPRLPAGDAVEPGEPRRDSFEEIAWVDAVVVRKGDDVRLQQPEGGVPRTREAARRLQQFHAQRRVAREYVGDAGIPVLVGHDQPKLAVSLRLQRLQQVVELVDAVDRRDDKVESHGRTLTPVPLISVLLAVHNDARHVGAAVESVLHQTLDDFELVVVDAAGTDDTPEVLARHERPVVLRNDERLGLAASLNRGLDAAQGRYVARLDSDDVALPHRLERQVAHIRSDARLAVVGSAVVDLNERDERGQTHVMPSGPKPLRWHALFSSPFFHPTVLVDREALDGLRYDPEFLESEDYDLWTRVFAVADGDNLSEPLVLKRVHAGQASQRRSEMQESFQRRVALREIERVAPGVDAGSAWRVGARKGGGSRREFLRLLRAFERAHGRSWPVRSAALQALVR